MECPPPMVSPSGWGARAVNQSSLTNLRLPLPEVVLIQTATFPACDSLSRCMQVVRDIQNYHIDNVDNPFTDIGYNFLIGDEGTIFEGRGWDKQGAFYSNHNALAYGIAFIGPFGPVSSSKPSLVAINASVRLVNCALSMGKLDAAKLRIVPYSINPAAGVDFLQHPDAPAPATSVAPPTVASTENFISGRPGMRRQPQASSLPDPGTTAVPVTTIVPISLAIGGGVLLLAVLLAGLWHLKKRSRKNDVYTEMRERLPIHVLHRYEINKNRVVIEDMNRDFIDHGHYGMVVKGKLQQQTIVNGSAVPVQIEVAIKMLLKCGRAAGGSGSSDRGLVTSFLAEMEMLLKTGRHVNIVNVIGIVLEDHPMIIMEYCSFGSLENFLKNPDRIQGLIRWRPGNTYLLLNHSTHTHVNTLSASQPADEYAVTSVDDLVRFGFQISRGMQFVSSRNIIHRDLAARNILLDSTGTAKITDFGMARQQTLYTLERNVELPTRWLALESLSPRNGTYNMKTDVWSFGVTFWEILSLCQFIPYEEDLPKGSDLVGYLLRGGRLARPAYCSEHVYEVIRQCWASDPQDRPTFAQLTDQLSTLLPLSMQQGYLLLDETNDAFNDDLHKRYEDSSNL